MIYPGAYVEAAVQRTAVVAVGPLANFLLALVVYFGMFVGPHTFSDTKLGVVSVGDPAWNAGIRAGDKLLSINGLELEQWSDVIEAVGSRPDQELMVEYERAALFTARKFEHVVKMAKMFIAKSSAAVKSES